MDALSRLMVGATIFFMIAIAVVFMARGENFERIARRGTNIRKDGAGHMNAHGLGVNPGRGGMPARRDSIYGTLPNDAPQSILGQNLYGYDKEPIAGASRSDLRNILTPDSPYYVPPNNTLYALGGAYNRPRGTSVQADEFTGDLATFNALGQRVDTFAGNALEGEAASTRRRARQDRNDGVIDGDIGQSTADMVSYARRRAAAARARAATIEAQRTANQAALDADNAAVSLSVQDAITAELAAAEANNLGSRLETRMRPMPNVGNVLNTL